MRSPTNPRRSGDLLGIIEPKRLRMTSRVAGYRRLFGHASHSQIGIRTHVCMIAQSTKKRQASSVALQVFRLSRLNGLQRRRKIFLRSVALGANSTAAFEIRKRSG